MSSLADYFSTNRPKAKFFLGDKVEVTLLLPSNKKPVKMQAYVMIDTFRSEEQGQIVIVQIEETNEILTVKREQVKLRR